VKFKIRPAIWLGIVALSLIAYFAMQFNLPEIAGVAVGGICATLPKLVESEEVSERESK